MARTFERDAIDGYRVQNMRLQSGSARMALQNREARHRERTFNSIGTPPVCTLEAVANAVRRSNALGPPDGPGLDAHRVTGRTVASLLLYLRV